MVPVRVSRMSLAKRPGQAEIEDLDAAPLTPPPHPLPEAEWGGKTASGSPLSVSGRGAGGEG